MEKASDLLNRLEEQSKAVRARIEQLHQSELASLEASLKDLTSGARRTIESDMARQLGLFGEKVAQTLGAAVEQMEKYRAEAAAKVEAGHVQMKRYWWERLLVGSLIYLGIFAGLWVPMQSLAGKVMDRVEQLDKLNGQIQDAEKTAGQAKTFSDAEGRKWVQVKIASEQIVRSQDGKRWVEIGAAERPAVWTDRQGRHWARMED